MVTYSESSLDRIFAALADPTRREILARLKQGDATVGELAEPFEISRPAISKHLDVLERAGLVHRVAEGRVNRCSFNGEPLTEALALMEEDRSHWDARPNALTNYLEREDEMGNSDALTLRLERRILASRERVFDAWTRGELVKHWSAPEGLTVEEGDQDVRPGGSWRVVMAEPNGARHEAFGKYMEVSPPDRLVYTHAWKSGNGGSTPETTLTLEFSEDGDATRLVLVQEGFENAATRDGHSEGWSSSLNELERFFAVGG